MHLHNPTIPQESASPVTNVDYSNAPPPAQGESWPQSASETAPITGRRIGAKAYDIWLAQGCPERSELENWQQAKEELMRQGSAC